MERPAETDTSRISITAYQTGYTWVKNGLSHAAFATIRGRAMYESLRPMMWVSRNLLGISDLETRLLQRHLIIDHLLSEAVEKHGVRQVLELGCGFSPRGFRFMERHEGRGFTYVEADLPAMARRKREILRDAGLLGPGHEVVTANILIEKGAESLRDLIGKRFDPACPIAVITEGVVSYFDAPTMRDFWARLARLMAPFPAGFYFTDNLSADIPPRAAPYLRLWQTLVGLVARGKLHAHFASDEAALETFRRAGFGSVAVHRPRDFAGRISMPSADSVGFLNVIEART